MTTEPTEKHREEARELLRTCEQRTGMDLASESLPNDLADRIASALASRDTEIRKVLEGLQTYRPDGGCWCRDVPPLRQLKHSPACIAARALYDSLQPVKEGKDGD